MAARRKSPGRKRTARTHGRDYPMATGRDVRRYRRPAMTVFITEPVKRYALTHRPVVDACVIQHFAKINFHGLNAYWGAPGGGSFSSICKATDGRSLYFATQFETGVTRISFTRKTRSS